MMLKIYFKKKVIKNKLIKFNKRLANKIKQTSKVF